MQDEKHRVDQFSFVPIGIIQTPFADIAGMRSADRGTGYPG
jgi:hypothetical protein